MDIGWALISGLLGGIVGAAVLRWANNRRSQAVRREDGGHELRPSWMIHLCTVLSIPIAALPIIGLANSGPDTATGELVSMILLFVGFSAGAMWCVWYGYGRRISWSGNEIRLHRWFLGDEMFRLPEVTGVEDRPAWSDFRIHFRDGRHLTVSKYSNGATKLVERAVSASASAG